MRKYIHISMAFLLLLSTSGVAISKYYCGNILQEVTILSDITSCCGDQEIPGCPCSNETDTYKVDSDFETVQFNSDVFEPKLLFTLNLFLNYFNPEKEQYNLFSNYKAPPLFEPSTIILKVQSFLL